MATALPTTALEQLFLNARTHNGWQNQAVSEEILHQLYEMLKFGPTSANASPARFIFVSSSEGKQRLKPALMEGNVDKTMTAPVTVIVAHDLEFYDHLPYLFPHADARSWYAGKPDAIADAAMRNGSLQGAYLILAARALGLDCGPMSGFDKEKVKAAFFPDQAWEANFLCNLGYGDVAALYPRGPRLAFEQACRIA